VEEYLAMAGIEDSELVPAVLDHLEHELALCADRIASEGSACPGAEAALSALAAVDSVEQTVQTGNIAANALVKLAAFGLDRYLDLEVGAYGEGHSDRRKLLSLAWKRQHQLRGAEFLPAQTWSWATRLGTSNAPAPAAPIASWSRPDGTSSRSSRTWGRTWFSET
jgi:hypothetical protein